LCSKFFDTKTPEAIDKYKSFPIGVRIENNGIKHPKEIEWEHAFYISGKLLGINEFEEALTTDFCKDPKYEKMVRLLLLYCYNDNFRNDSKYKLPDDMQANFINNIEGLIRIYSNYTNVTDGMFLAELYREKSDFDKSIEILNNIKTDNDDDRIVKEKLFSLAKRKDNIVRNLDRTFISKEFKCNKCGDSVIVFDIEKADKFIQLGNYICNTGKHFFNATAIEQNKAEYYKLSFFQKLFKLKRPYKYYVLRKEIKCPVCDSADTKLYNLKNEKCVKCGEGDYFTVKWFE